MSDVLFSLISCGCVCCESTRMQCGLTTSWWKKCDALSNVLLGNPGFGHSCGCKFDTCHLPKHCYIPSWQWCFLVEVASFSRLMHPSRLHTLFRNGLRNKSTRCCSGLQIPQISIELSICGMCWTNKFDPWRLYFAAYRTWSLGVRYHSTPSGVL